MKIIYEAFDGTQFDDEFKCTDYEWKKEHNASFKDLIFYDIDGKVMLGDKLIENIYNNVMKIEVLSNNAVQLIQDIADYTGFCCYYDIDSIGKWSWNEKEKKFKKNEISLDI